MSDKPQSPPELPWRKGKQAEYSAFSITVDVCEDQNGRVWSGHSYETSQDESTALELANGGAPQIAFALLTEAMRREAFCLVLVKLSSDPEFLATWKSLSEDDKRTLEVDLGDAARRAISDTMAKMAPGIGREILAMLSSMEGEGDMVSEQPE